MVGRGDLQETTRLIGLATLVVNMFLIKLWMWMCGLTKAGQVFLGHCST